MRVEPSPAASSTAARSGRGTAWTLLAFFVGAAALSTTPGVPAALRPVDATTPAARAALVEQVLSRPRTSLGDQERRALGDVVVDVDRARREQDGVDPADDNDGERDAPGIAADEIPADDVDVDVDAGALPTRREERRTLAQSGGHPDRGAFLDAFPRSKDDVATAAALARLAMPGADVENPCVERDGAGGCVRSALDPLFSTLDALAAGDARARAAIVVLGNSLIASDHVVDIVRRDLVARFGDGGRGLLLPERLSKTAGRRTRTGHGSPGWSPRSFGLDDPVAGDVYGLTGSVHEATVDGETTVWTADGATLGRLRWIDDGRALRVDVDGVEALRIAAHGTPSGRMRSRAFPLARGARAIRLVAARGARVVDVVLERDAPGVVVDTIGIPAASARGFVERTDAAAFVDELAQRDPALVVFMLGGNETRSMAAGALDDARFAELFTRLVDRVRAASPRTACLIVTPIDSTTTTTADATLVTRPETHRVVDVERRVAAAAGCAFFDLFAAMGGDGSLARMRDADLVSDDLVHPRARGANLLGDLMSRALLASWRKTPPAAQPVVARRNAGDPGRPRFAGLSFPEEGRAVVVDGGAAGDESPTRPHALARFFARLAALEDGRRMRVAVGQFGASHTAGQMLTDRMRQRLGARFGEMGRGYIAAGTASNRLTPSGVFREVSGAFDLADGREVKSGGAVGMAGTKLRLAPGARFRVGFCAGCPVDTSHAKGTLSLSWLYTPDMGVADVFVDGVRVASLSSAERRRDTDVQRLVVPIDGERTTLDVVARDAVKDDGGGQGGGPIHLLSVSEEMHRPGIVLDAAGLAGTTAMTAQRWRQDLFAEEVRARDYDLVVTAWGTNEAGLASLDEATYRRHFAATLDTLQAASPRADCLVLGATDRFDHRGNVLVPAPSHDVVERVQRSLAAERGCAFFSLRDVMGGPGSMRRWVGEGLARNDHVHFTRAGYARLADAIVDDLLAAYAWSSSDPARLVVDDTDGFDGDEEASGDNGNDNHRNVSGDGDDGGGERATTHGPAAPDGKAAATTNPPAIGAAVTRALGRQAAWGAP
jgi:lysophospholipase L1-like esterase